MDKARKEQIHARALKMRDFRKKLRDTDYQAIKFAEGVLTMAEFAEMKQQRQAWRAEINALETEIDAIRKGC